MLSSSSGTLPGRYTVVCPGLAVGAGGEIGVVVGVVVGQHQRRAVVAKDLDRRVTRGRAVGERPVAEADHLRALPVAVPERLDDGPIRGPGGWQWRGHAGHPTA